MLNVLLAESQQVHQPAGLVQVVLGSSLHGASFRLLDHKQQQQHRDQSQTRSHLRRANTAQSISTDTQVHNRSVFYRVTLTRRAQCQS